MPFAQNNTINIFYQEVGEGDPLFLIMGLGATGDVWEKHRVFYQEKFRCIVIDNRGVGKSSVPTTPYTTDDMARDVIAVADNLSIQQFRVAGISMGGAICQKLCINYPERIISQVIVSSWPQCDTPTKMIFRQLKINRKQMPASDFISTLQTLIFTPSYLQSHVDELRENQKAAQDDPQPQINEGFERQCDACSSHDALSKLETITTPTLITAGDKDHFTPLHLSQTLHRNIKHSKLIIYAGTGHAHHWEVLDSFNEDSRRFLLAH